MKASDLRREPDVFVANGLERLMRLPLGSADELEEWDTACHAFQRELESRFPTFKLEHHVWHFFTDSDIRLKEPGYRDAQHRAISDYIRRLRA